MPFRLRTVVTANRKQVGKKSKKVLEKRKKVVTLQSRFTKTGINNAEIAQLVEHDLAKVGVASSSLVFRSDLRGAIAGASFLFKSAFQCDRRPIFCILGGVVIRLVSYS